MQAFIDRVNATLPTNEPDGILLTLVQAQPDKVCGKPCPARQGLSNAGLCLPYAILARTGGAKIGAMPGETQISTINGWATTTVADAALLPPTNTEPLVDPTPPATIAPAQKSAPRRAIASRRQPQVSRKGNWAQNLFNQSLN
jgi:hypothetical protein